LVWLTSFSSPSSSSSSIKTRICILCCTMSIRMCCWAILIWVCCFVIQKKTHNYLINQILSWWSWVSSRHLLLLLILCLYHSRTNHIPTAHAKYMKITNCLNCWGFGWCYVFVVQDKLVREGKGLVAVLYTYRSCVKALPQVYTFCFFLIKNIIVIF
jgi:hypothetical protein